MHGGCGSWAYYEDPNFDYNEETCVWMWKRRLITHTEQTMQLSTDPLMPNYVNDNRSSN